MKQFTKLGADRTAGSVFALYTAMEDKFGPAAAWEFVLAFYHGAGVQTSNEYTGGAR